MAHINWALPVCPPECIRQRYCVLLINEGRAFLWTRQRMKLFSSVGLGTNSHFVSLKLLKSAIHRGGQKLPKPNNVFLNVIRFRISSPNLANNVQYDPLPRGFIDNSDLTAHIGKVESGLYSIDRVNQVSKKTSWSNHQYQRNILPYFLSPPCDFNATWHGVNESQYWVGLATGVWGTVLKAPSHRLFASLTRLNGLLDHFQLQTAIWSVRCKEYNTAPIESKRQDKEVDNHRPPFQPMTCVQYLQ